MRYCQDCEEDVVSDSWADHVRYEHQLVPNHHGVRYEREPRAQWPCPHPECDKAYGKSIVASRHYERHHKGLIIRSPEPPGPRTPIPAPVHVGNRRDGVSTSPRTHSPIPSPAHVVNQRDGVPTTPTSDHAPVVSPSELGRAVNQREQASTSQTLVPVFSTSTHPVPASSSSPQRDTEIISVATTIQDGIYVPSLVPDFIFSDSLLDTFDLVVDTTVGVVICRACGHALRPNGVYNHIRDAHGGILKKHKQSAKNLVGECLVDLYGERITHPYPQKPTPTVLPSLAIPYLKIHAGFLCPAPDCFHCEKSKSHVVTHINECHDGSFKPKWTLIQSYYLANELRYFPVVIPACVPDGTRTRYNKYVAFVESLPAAPMPPPTSAKEMDPFFSHFRWFEHIAPYEDRQALVDLVKLTAANECERRVKDAMLKYFKDIAEEIDSMPNQTVIEMLSKKDGDSYHRFSKPQEEDTIVAHSNAFSRYILGLLRSIPLMDKDASHYRFKLTDVQVDHATSLIDVMERDDSRPSERREMLHQFMFAMFSTVNPASLSNQYNCAITCFIILSQLQTNHSFKDPGHMSTSIGHLQWCVRAVVLQEIIVRGKAEAEISNSDIDYVTPCTRLFESPIWSPGSAAPYGRIQYWLRITQQRSRTAIGEGSVMWSPDERTLLYKGGRMPLAKLGEFLQNLTSELDDIITYELLYGSVMDIKMPDMIFDDINNSTKGYSWVTDTRNEEFTSPFANHFYYREIVSKIDAASNSLVDGTTTGGFRLNRAGANKWLAVIQRMKLIMGVLFKMACSGPPRDTEEMTLALINTGFRRRSFFFLEKELVFVIEYSKTSWANTNPDVIPRAVYNSLAVLFIKYILILLPFELILRQSLAPDEHVFAAYRHLLFADERGPFPTGSISKEMSSRMNIVFDLPIGTRAFRHLGQAIIDHTCPSAFLTVGWVNFGLKSLGHSENTGRRLYARDMHSFGAKDPEESIQLLKVSRHVHSVYGLGPGNPPPPYLSTLPIDASFVSAAPSILQPPTLLPSSSQTPPPKLSDVRIAVSEEITQAIAGGQLIVPPTNVKRQSLPVVTWDTIQHFRRFFGDDSARFKIIEQGQALQMVLDNVRSGLVILPTGGGKSLLFMLPALLAADGYDGGKFTVVMVPYKALETDILRRCNEMKIHAAQWLQGIELDNVTSTILTISADQARHPSTFDFLRMAHAEGRLRSVFCDEIHTIFEDMRKPLLHLKELSTIPVPKYLLTATLSLEREKDLLEMFKADDLLVVRAPSVRPNITYRVYSCATEEFHMQFDILLEKLRIAYPRGKGLIITRTQLEAASLGNKYNFPYYHADLSHHDKREAIKEFDRDPDSTMAATICFGTGIDHSSIRFVIHYGGPYSLVGYTQESGRAGRDGLPATSAILYPHDDPVRSCADQKGKDKIFEFRRLG